MGILAAVAVPRYMDMRQHARVAKMEAVYGDLSTAARIAHSAALTSGNTASVTLQGVAVSLINGYPSAGDTGIIAAANLDATRDDISITHVAGAPNYTQITYSDLAAAVSAGGNTCYVNYYEAGTGAAPTLEKVTSSC